MNQQIVLFLFLMIMFSNCSSSKKISTVSIGLDIENIKNKRGLFLQEATLYGLKKDQFPLEIANSLVEEPSNWVIKCPICDNVKRGFKMYLDQGAKAGKSKVSKGNLSRLSEKDLDLRKIALRDLVDGYVQQYYSVLEMTKEEQQNMKAQLEDGRETGMSVANGGEGFFCASCDGACHKKE